MANNLYWFCLPQIECGMCNLIEPSELCNLVFVVWTQSLGLIRYRPGRERQTTTSIYLCLVPEHRVSNLEVVLRVCFHIGRTVKCVGCCIFLSPYQSQVIFTDHRSIFFKTCAPGILNIFKILSFKIFRSGVERPNQTFKLWVYY